MVYMTEGYKQDAVERDTFLSLSLSPPASLNCIILSKVNPLDFTNFNLQ